MYRSLRKDAGALLGLLSVLCVAAQLPNCDDQLERLSGSCSATGNASIVQARIASYFGQSCTPSTNGNEATTLEVLVSSTVRLPPAVLERFQADTGWTVRVTSWDEASGSLPPPAEGSVSSSSSISARRRSLTEQSAAANLTTASQSSSVQSDSDWRQVLATSYDAWILDSQLLAGLGYGGLLAPPAKLLDPASFVELRRALAPQVRLFGTTYKYQAAALPLGSNALVLYAHGAALTQLYNNAPLRKRLGLALSASSAEGAGSGGGGGNATSSAGAAVVLPSVWSWEQLVDAVAAVNGTDFDGDGVEEHGMCLDVSPGCMAPALVQAVAASYIQTRGSSAGVLLDPDTMTWRLQGAGFSMALWTLQRLLAYSHTGGGSGGSSGGRAPTCRRLSAAFAEGRCAFTIHTAQHLKAAYAWPARDAGAVAAARVMPLPGSARVVRLGFTRLQTCTAATCPFAVAQSSTTGLQGAIAGTLSWLSGASAVTSGLTAINVAPLAFGMPISAVSAVTPSPYSAAAARLLVYLASAAVQAELASDLESGVTPCRRLDQGNATAAGGPSEAQLAEMAAVQAQLWGHPNAAPALRFPGVEATWPLFDTVVAQLQLGDPFVVSGANLPLSDDDWRVAQLHPSPAVEAAVEALSAALPRVLDAAVPNKSAQRAEYLSSLAYRQLVLTPQVEVPEEPPVTRKALVTGLAVGLSTGALVLLLAAAVHARHSLRRLRRTASQGDDSSNRRSTATYVALDIQGLSGDSGQDAVREQALRQCHDVIKQLARRYNGSQVTLPQTELQQPPMPHAKPVPSAALEAVIRAELAAAVEPSADGQQPGAWAGGLGTRAGGEAAALSPLADGAGKALTGGCPDGEGAGGMESSSAPRCRPGYWTYDSGYLSLASRDLDAMPSHANVAGGFALDGGASASALPTPPRASPSAPQDLVASPAGRGVSGQATEVSEERAGTGSGMRLPTVAGHVSPPRSPQQWSSIRGEEPLAAAPAGLPFATPVVCEPTTAASSALAMSYSGGAVQVASKSGGGLDEEGSSIQRVARPSPSDTVQLSPLHMPISSAAGGGTGGGSGSGVLLQLPTAVCAEILLQSKPQPIRPQQPSRAVSPSPSVMAFTPGQSTPGGTEAMSVSPASEQQFERATNPSIAARSSGAGAGMAHSSCGTPDSFAQGPTPTASQHMLHPPQVQQQQQQQHHHHQQQQQHHISPRAPSSVPRSYSPETSQLLCNLENGAVHHAGLMPSPLPSPLPSLPEGAAAGPGGNGELWPHGSGEAAHGAGLHVGASRGGVSLPATPLVGRDHAISPPRLRRVPYTPLVGAVASGHSGSPSAAQPSVARTGALAVAMAAARAAAMAAGAAAAPAAPLPTRMALMFSSVYDAVCFCVHMQAMLTNVRWPAEVLQLPECKQVSVRPRSVGDSDQQTTELRAAKERTANGSRRNDTAANAAGSAAAGALATGDSGGGGGVVASAQSSFVVASNSPFSAAGAVDRMKSLIVGGVRGRSTRLPRLPQSPRVAGALVPVGPDRSAPSVSRFAAASMPPTSFAGTKGAGVAAASGDEGASPLGTPTPAAGIGAGLASGLGPWVAGTTAGSSATSRDGSVTAWCPPPFAGMQAPPFPPPLSPVQAASGSSSAAGAILRGSSGGEVLLRATTPPRSPLGLSRNIDPGKAPNSDGSPGLPQRLSPGMPQPGPAVLRAPTWRGGTLMTSHGSNAFLDSSTLGTEMEPHSSGGGGGSTPPVRFATVSPAAIVHAAAAAAAAAATTAAEAPPAAAAAAPGNRPAGAPSGPGGVPWQGSHWTLMEARAGRVDAERTGRAGYVDTNVLGAAASPLQYGLLQHSQSLAQAGAAFLPGPTPMAPGAFMMPEAVAAAAPEQRPGAVWPYPLPPNSLSRAHPATSGAGMVESAASPASAGSHVQLSVTQLPVVSAHLHMQRPGSASHTHDSAAMVGSAVTLVVPGAGAGTGHLPRQPHSNACAASPPSGVVIGVDSDPNGHAVGTPGASVELPQLFGSFSVRAGGELPSRLGATALPRPVGEGAESGHPDEEVAEALPQPPLPLLPSGLGPTAAAARSGRAGWPWHGRQLVTSEAGLATKDVSDIVAPGAGPLGAGAASQGVPAQGWVNQESAQAAAQGDGVELTLMAGAGCEAPAPPARQESHLTVSSLGPHGPSPLQSPLATGLESGGAPALHNALRQHDSPQQRQHATHGSQARSQSWLLKLQHARRSPQPDAAGSCNELGAAGGVAAPAEPIDYAAHHSMPLHRIRLDEHGGGNAIYAGAISANLVKLPALPPVSGQAEREGDSRAGQDFVAGQAGGARAAASALCVRSFGEQVHMTFEALESTDLSAAGDGVTVIFRGPRVVCGISTWQCGDDDEGVVDQDPPLLPEAHSAADGDVLGDSGGGGDGAGADTAEQTPGSQQARQLEEMRAVMAENSAEAALPEHRQRVLAGDTAADASLEAGTHGACGPDFSMAHSNPLFIAPVSGRTSQRQTPSDAEAGAAVAAACEPHSQPLPTANGMMAVGGMAPALLLPAAVAAALGSQANQADTGAPASKETASLAPSPDRLAAAAFGYDASSLAAGAAVGASEPQRTAVALKRLNRRRLPAALRRALDICESGQGGFVLLDSASYSATSQEVLQEQCMILHMGEYVLTDAGEPPLDLYLALDFAHLARLAYLRPLAAVQQLSLGLLSAPVNSASIVFTLVTGMQALMAWNSEVAKNSLGVLREAVLSALLRHGGYLVEDADGLLLTAFPSSRSALAWALECQAEAKHLDWPEELLGHTLGEAVYLEEELATGELEEGAPTSISAVANAQPSPLPGGHHTRLSASGLPPSSSSPALLRGTFGRHLVFRGLRFKCGMDCGDVLARVHTTTGRMTYRGRVMNRSARIAGMATAGQVLCSRGLWNDSGLETAPELCEKSLALGESMGEVQLKGLSSKMEVINCIRVLRADLAPTAQGSSLELPLLNLAHTGLPFSTVGSATAPEEAGANGTPTFAAPAASPILMKAVPLLGDSDDDEGMADGGGAASGGEGRLSAARRGELGSPSVVGREGASYDLGKPTACETEDADAAAAMVAPEGIIIGDPDRQSPRRELPSVPDSAGCASRASLAAKLSAPLRSATARYAYGRSSVTHVPRGVMAIAGASSAGPAGRANGPVGRVRRASLLHHSRFVHSGGMPLDRAGSSAAAAAVAGLASVGGLRSTTSGAVLAAAAMMAAAPEEEDDLADRLVAGYSSDDGSDGSGGEVGELRPSGGSVHLQDRPSTAAGVAALHGVLRRQRAASTMGVVPPGGGGGGGGGAQSGAAGGAVASGVGGTSSGSGAIPTATGGGGGGGPAAVGNLATAAKANIKKALRAVRRSILDDPGGGGGGDGRGGSDSGDDRPSQERWRALQTGADSDGSDDHRPSTRGAAGGAASGGGGGGARVRRSPRRRQGQAEPPKQAGQPSVPPAPAGAPAGRLFERLRSLALPAARGGKARGGTTASALDDLDVDGVPLRPMASANSEYFTSRGGSSLASAARIGSRLVVRGGGAPGASLSVGSGAGAGSPQLHKGSLGHGSGGGGGGAVSRSSSRLVGHGLVAEMSLASMTMRRHIPVSQLLGAAAAGPAAGRSFRQLLTRGGGSSGGADDDAGAAAPSAGQSHQGLGSRRVSATAVASPGAAPSPGHHHQQQQQSPIAARHRSQTNSPRPFATPYGIREDEDEDDSGSEGTPAGSRGASGAGPHQRGSRPSSRSSGARRAAAGAAAGSPGGNSLPARLLSFTSSFLQRHKKPQQQSHPQDQQPPQQQRLLTSQSQPPHHQLQLQQLRPIVPAVVAETHHLIRTNSSDFADRRASGGGVSVRTSGDSHPPGAAVMSPPGPLRRQLSRMGSSCRTSTAEITSGPMTTAAGGGGPRPAEALSNSFTATRVQAAPPSTRNRPATGPGVVPNAPVLTAVKSHSSQPQQHNVLQSFLTPPHFRQHSGQRAAMHGAAAAALGPGVSAAAGAGAGAGAGPRRDPSPHRSAVRGSGSGIETRSADVRSGCSAAGPGSAAAAGSLADPLTFEANAAGGATGWTGLFVNSLHNLLGLAPHGGGGGGTGSGQHAVVSPRGSLVIPAPVTSCSHSGGGGAGTGSGGGGGPSVPARGWSRQGSRRREEAGAEAHGGGAGGGGVGSAARANRRRSVIEISGNMMILNAGSSYTAGGWNLDTELSELMPQISSVQEAPDSPAGTSRGSLYGSSDATALTVTQHNSPRRRRSQRMLAAAGNPGSVGSGRPRQDSAERRRSLFWQVSVTRNAALNRPANANANASATSAPICALPSQAALPQQSSMPRDSSGGRGRAGWHDGRGASSSGIAAAPGAEDGIPASGAPDAPSSQGLARLVRGVGGLLSRSNSTNSSSRANAAAAAAAAASGGGSVGGPVAGQQKPGPTRYASGDPDRSPGAPGLGLVRASASVRRRPHGGVAAGQPQPLPHPGGSRPVSSDAVGLLLPRPAPMASAAAPALPPDASAAGAAGAVAASRAVSPRCEDRQGGHSRRLVPELARSARGLMGRVLSSGTSSAADAGSAGEGGLAERLTSLESALPDPAADSVGTSGGLMRRPRRQKRGKPAGGSGQEDLGDDRSGDGVSM